MKWRFFFLLTLSFASALTAQNIDLDFSNSENFPGKLKRAMIENEVLVMKRGSNATLPVEATQPIRISFKYRIDKIYPAKHNNNHMTVGFNGNDGQHSSIHFFAKRPLACYVRKNGKTKEGKGPALGTTLRFDENKWYDITIDVWSNKLNVNVENQNVIALKQEKLLPIQSIGFAAYQLDAAIDDLKIAPKPKEELKTVDKAVFSADFDESVDAINENGKTIQPEVNGTIEFADGVEGKAMASFQGRSFRDNPLVYPLDDPFLNKAGGLMFWVKKNKNGDLFQLTDADGKAKIFGRIGGDWLNAVRIHVKQANADKPLAYIRSIPGSMNDWVHVALTWDEDLNARYFINGMPYWISFKPGQRCPDFLNTDVEGIKKLVFSPKVDAEFDRFRLFKRTLTNKEVYDEYRAIMPIDMVMDQIIVDEDKPVKLQVQVAPGGFYTRPMPIESDYFIPDDVAIKFELKNDKGETVFAEERTVNVDRPLDLDLQEVKLAKGNYQLIATIKHDEKAFRRTFDVTAFTQKYKPQVSSEPLKLGKLIYQRKLNALDSDILSAGDTHVPTGKDYLQAGNDKGNRFCFEIPFDKNVLGKPVILEITWPDDQLRSMSWYMYPYGVSCNRDRLQTGVQAGNEFPNSGKLISTRHIFFPGVSKYLFEARTMAPNMPAAVAEIKIYEIDGDLPKLSINYPKNLPGRRYGHYDEDQTFTSNLNIDMTSAKSPVRETFEKEYAKNITAFFTDELVRYFGYTGMNTMHYPIWRYLISFLPLEGHTGNGLYPGGCGELSYLFERFAKNDLKFIAIMDYYNVPDIALLDKIQSNYIQEGMVTLDRYGDNIKMYSGGNHLANICHPKVLDLFVRYFEDPVKRYSKISGFDGIEYWLAHFGSWKNLECGYDDYTVNKFSKETGIEVPTDIKKRYDFLTKAPVREKWLKWRAEQVTNLVKCYRSILDKYNSELKFFLNIPQSKKNYVEHGINYDALKAIPGVFLAIARRPTQYRHDFHWGKPERTIYEEMYDFHSDDLKNYLQDGVASSVTSGHTYFETFVHPLNKEYKCYFENSDVKAHSRYFLREFAFVVGAFDAQEYTLGAQPMCAVGREDESREFAKAFCALPAKPFKKVSGICDPAVARTLDTDSGTYFYVVNMFHYPVKVSFKRDKNAPYVDLSTDEELTGNELELKPFQLRSFLFPKAKVVVSDLAFVETSPEADEFYQKRIDTLKKSANLLKQSGVVIPDEEKTLVHLETLLKEKQYAELYRLAFSRDMNQLLKKTKNLSNIVKQQKMIDAGQYAVNCGTTDFFNASNGKLFFPDQAYNGKYGYFGKLSKSCGREVTGLTNTDMAELYKSEAYDIDGYKFKVPNGKYKVIIYMKCGFKPGFALPNVFRFTVKANGKTVLDKYDLYKESGGDFNKALKETINNVEVTNGELNLEWEAVPFRSPRFTTTARMANAIEIIKQ